MDFFQDRPAPKSWPLAQTGQFMTLIKQIVLLNVPLQFSSLPASTRLTSGLHHVLTPAQVIHFIYLNSPCRSNETRASSLLFLLSHCDYICFYKVPVWLSVIYRIKSTHTFLKSEAFSNKNTVRITKPCPSCSKQECTFCARTTYRTLWKCGPYF